MFNNRVVNGPGWIVTQSRIELAAPEGLLHSLLTSCLILIRMYRSEGAARGWRWGGDMCPPIVCLMVNHAVMAGGGESKWERERGIKEVHKGPPLFMGVTQSGWAPSPLYGTVTCTAPAHVAHRRGPHTYKTCELYVGFERKPDQFYVSAFEWIHLPTLM